MSVQEKGMFEGTENRGYFSLTYSLFLLAVHFLIFYVFLDTPRNISYSWLYAQGSLLITNDHRGSFVVPEIRWCEIQECGIRSTDSFSFFFWEGESDTFWCSGLTSGSTLPSGNMLRGAPRDHIGCCGSNPGQPARCPICCTITSVLHLYLFIFKNQEGRDPKVMSAKERDQSLQMQGFLWSNAAELLTWSWAGTSKAMREEVCSETCPSNSRWSRDRTWVKEFDSHPICPVETLPQPLPVPSKGKASMWNELEEKVWSFNYRKAQMRRLNHQKLVRDIVALHAHPGTEGTVVKGACTWSPGQEDRAGIWKV